MKKFLVVGNGFDLAHKLPTKYGDFLYFLVLCLNCMSNWKNFGTDDYKHNYKLEKFALDNILKKSLENNAVKNIFDENIKSIKQKLKSDEMKDFYKNDLMKYMICVYASKMNLADEFHWIDVEDELMKFITTLNSSNNIDIGNAICLKIPYHDEYEKTFRTFYCSNISKKLEEFANIPEYKLKNKLFEYIFSRLEQFSLLLKFYLELVMNKFHNEKNFHFRFSSDVNNELYFSHIISFNYTNTSKIYNPNAKIYYVNGSIIYKDIILGIENPFSSNSQEYLNDNVHLFFKNVQRIMYDFEYKHNRWFESTKDDFSPKDNEKKYKPDSRYVYIVGHSLALNDKYILLDIIEKADKTRIYYFSEDDKKSKITNLYKILGDEKFYEYVNNDSAKHRIVLCDQKDIEIKF